MCTRFCCVLTLALLCSYALTLALSLLYINTCSSIASALVLTHKHCLCFYTNTFSITVTAFELSLKLDQRVFSSAVCALCPCCPGAGWPQRSHDGGVVLRAFERTSGFHWLRSLPAGLCGGRCF